jgi:hypothetical protein
MGEGAVFLVKTDSGKESMNSALLAGLGGFARSDAENATAISISILLVVCSSFRAGLKKLLGLEPRRVICNIEPTGAIEKL